MKFGYTIIYVNDVAAALNFYKKMFNLEILFLHDSKQYGELNTGETKIAFVSNALAESNGVTFIKNDIKNTAAGFEIALVTKDVNEAYQHAIKNGAISLKGPMKKPWGQEVAYVRDLNGIIIELCSPMG